MHQRTERLHASMFICKLIKCTIFKKNDPYIYNYLKNTALGYIWKYFLSITFWKASLICIHAFEVLVKTRYFIEIIFLILFSPLTMHFCHKRTLMELSILKISFWGYPWYSWLCLPFSHPTIIIFLWFATSHCVQ